MKKVQGILISTLIGITLANAQGSQDLEEQKSFDQWLRQGTVQDDSNKSRYKYDVGGFDINYDRKMQNSHKKNPEKEPNASRKDRSQKDFLDNQK